MKRFFYPQSIVVIGVSEKPSNMGRMIVQNLIENGFTGQVRSVGPNGGVVQGRPIRKSVKDISFPLDMAVILTPAAIVPGLMRECGEVGIRRIVIESAGFSEFSSDLRSLEEELLAVAEEFGIRFIGPNCLGVLNTENGLATPFNLETNVFKRGKISIVAQSGGVAKTYMDFLALEGAYINKLTSVGNMLNVDESDLLDYLVHEDEGTDIICMYLEDIRGGRRFIEIAKKSAKPIIVHKSGVGKVGAASAASHTAALAADDEVVSAAFKQAGIIRVRSTAEIVDFGKIFQLPPMKGRNLAIVSRSGGHGVIAADTAEHFGFEFPPFPPKDLEKIRQHVRAGVVNLRNPLDLGDLFDLTVYEEIVKMVLANEQFHGMILVHGYGEVEKERSRRFVRMVQELGERYQKPVVICLLVTDKESVYLKQNLRFPFFKSPERGVQALSISYQHHQFQQHRQEIEPDIETGDSVPARAIIEQVISESRRPSQAECFEVLKLYHIPVPEYRAIRTAREASEAAKEIGLPVVLKIDVLSMLHKSDVGGVILDLGTPEAAAAAFAQMQDRLADVLAPNESFAALVMKQAKMTGQEVIFGVKQDPTFGPALLFGMGGVLAELIEDVSLRVAPLDRNDILEMVQEVRGYKVLAGTRGSEPRDINSLVEILMKLFRLAQDIQEIKEIDLNPVMSYPDGCLILDARFIL